MSCLICGDICRCSFAANAGESNAGEVNIPSPRWLSDPDTTPQIAAPQVVLETLPPTSDLPALEQAAIPSTEEEPEEGSQAWRHEVAARLYRYQARRKPRPPRYPSLRLPFEEPQPAVTNSLSEPQFFPRTTVSNHALALDSFPETSAPQPETLSTVDLFTQRSQNTSVPSAPDVPLQQPSVSTATAKILEFPRSWTPTPPPLDELAEPVIDRPRILDAPEVVPPAPALGGITIEPARQPEVARRPGVDIPLQSAPLPQRILAAVIDGAIIAMGDVIFSFIFWKLTAIRPPRMQIVGLGAALSSLFWAAYQYLLMIYAGTTPGLLIAKLRLAHFDGSRADRKLRRWRVIASFLSAASLGMGYLWVFLDEDSLCWHDRITHTYLAPKG
jgi:uncharacterized RDD family membrane protein YckC